MGTKVRPSAGVVRVGVVGASGYAGVELLRLCVGHPDLQVEVATAGERAGQSVAEVTPSLASAYPHLFLSPTDPALLSGLDLVFLALPHGRSQSLVPELVDRVGIIVDLAADFRLRDPSLYPTWYHQPHRVPELLERFTYGLPEVMRDELVDARLIAAPGCYPTAAILALGPFVDAEVVEPSGAIPFIVDAASGVSGGGRAATDRLHFGAVDGDFQAYGLLDHRHTPEIEQGLGATVLFTPHLAPMSRGILATCYARPRAAAGGEPLTTERGMSILRERYDREPFVVVVEDPPSTKATTGSNSVHLSARVDPRTGWLIVLAALDNLVKGAAGQAIQCANLALGVGEETGLAKAGIYP
ncbi:MAG: N-acetyl-gamma-glutamyl-phosphate reductase [Acidimicrobiales bacterium]